MTEATEPSRPENDVEMGFFDHLRELRKRLIRALWGLIPTVTVAWFYSRELLEILGQPLVKALKKQGLPPALHFANPVDPFVAQMKVSLVVGLLAASPWVFWQVWAFIAPGLYAREKKLAIPFMLASTLFFAGGAVFGFIVVFPLGFDTLLGFGGMLPGGSLDIQSSIMIGEYLDFTLQMLIAFGVVFEVPVVVTFLALAGIVDWRQLLRFGRWWLVASSVIAAVLTPPDVISQLLMLVPLVGLYYAAVLIAFFIGKKKKPADVL